MLRVFFLGNLNIFEIPQKHKKNGIQFINPNKESLGSKFKAIYFSYLRKWTRVLVQSLE